MLAPRGVGEQQAGHVAAGGEEHESDGAEKEPERAADPADLSLLQRRDPRAPAGVGLVDTVRARSAWIRVRSVSASAADTPGFSRPKVVRIRASRDWVSGGIGAHTSVVASGAWNDAGMTPTIV